MPPRKFKPEVPTVDPPMSDRSKRLSKLVRAIDGFQLWSSVEAPMVLRTGITSLNRATRVGGVVGGQLGVLHGPSQGGKSLLLAEIIRAAHATGGWGLFVDAECRATDLKWFHAICGALDEILYFKPQTFEKTIEKVEVFRRAFRIAKEKGEVPAGAVLCVGVDSISRLTPGDELAEFLKKSPEVKARGYPLRALMISKWLDRLIPDLKRDEFVVFVQREGVNLDAAPGQRRYKVKGGVAPIYDGGWILRVTSVGSVKKEVADKEDKVLVGEKHEIEVLKNSSGPHLSELAYFYSSVGSEDRTPLGLDRVREVREEALHRGLIRKVGSPEAYRVVGADGELGEDVARSKLALLEWLRAEGEDGRTRWESIAERLDGEFSRRSE